VAGGVGCRAALCPLPSSGVGQSAWVGDAVAASPGRGAEQGSAGVGGLGRWKASFVVADQPCSLKALPPRLY